MTNNKDVSGGQYWNFSDNLSIYSMNTKFSVTQS